MTSSCHIHLAIQQRNLGNKDQPPGVGSFSTNSCSVLFLVNEEFTINCVLIRPKLPTEKPV